MDARLSHVTFTIPSVEEIVTALSAVEITNPMTTVDFAKNNTMFDSRMGAFRNVNCDTCSLSFQECPGHHGRIRLELPCVNSRFVSTVMKDVLSSFCFGCFKHVKRCECESEMTGSKKRVRKPKVKPKMIKVCQARKKDNKKYLLGLKYYFRWEHLSNDTHLTIKEVYDFMTQIPRAEWINEFPRFSSYKCLAEGPFLHYLLVLPTTSRPPNMMNGEWKPDPITRLYLSVLKKNIHLGMKKDTASDILKEEFHNGLQAAIDILFDTSQTNYKLRGKILENGGLRQRIDGKEGRLRMNLMGKRTEFSARTVLSGDPMLGINQVGVPRRIADNLTIPVMVNRYNFHVVHTKFKIKYVFKPDGRKFDMNISTNCRIEIGDTVERCLMDGDVVAVNRQPTLHRGSIIACYVKIFDTLTFRLNYSTMVTLNADTDGDEVNVHVPQDLESRAELEELMLASTNIVSSQSSKPLVGCTQDSLLGCYLISKERKLPINDYMSIINAMGLDDPIFDVRKTTPYVDGSRFITAALNEVGMDMSRYEPHDRFLLIDNVVQYGVLDKRIVGKADDSLIHHIYLTVGHLKASRFIHLIQTAAYTYLDIVGFSVGIADCIVDHEKIDFDNLETHLEENFLRKGGKWTDQDEDELTDALGELTKLEAPKAAHDNRLLDMIVSGSKGTMANFNQITRVVGQQVEESGRVTKRFNDGARTLPHYTKHDPSAGSRGLVKSSFIKGLSPQEFFMHAMGGRIGLIDTACKTAETGAQYRRLVKVMEPLVTKDFGENKRLVMNNITGQVVQFEYGEDSYDGTYLKRIKC